MIALLVAALAIAAPEERRTPLVPPLQQPTMPEPQVLALSDGTPVWWIVREGVPLVRVEVSLRLGHLAAPDPVALRIAGALLSQGTASHPGADWQGALGALGAESSTGVGTLRAWADVEMLAGTEAEAVPLLADAVRSPAFSRADVRRVRRVWAESADAAWRSGARVMDAANVLAVYPADHPRGRLDTARDYRRVTRRRVRAAWRWLLENGAPAVFVVGDAQPGALLPLLDAAWAGLPGHREPALEQPPMGAGSRLILVDHPGSELALVRVSLPGPGALDPDLPATRVAAQVLGGGFTSRLNTRLREDLGITYGAGSSLVLNPGFGRLNLDTSVAPEDTVVALTELNDAVLRMGLLPPSGSELRAARRALVLEHSQTLSTLRTLAFPYGEAQLLGLGPGAPAANAIALSAVDDPTAVAAARRVADSDDAIWVIVADRFTVEPLLEAAGWTPDAIWSGEAVVQGEVTAR
jgi:zinc protease